MVGVSLLPLLALGGVAAPHAAVAQEVIVHDNFFADDGNPVRDADGAPNGVVVWKGGAVHVIKRYDLQNYATLNQALIVQPGAIVKVAGDFQTDASGHVTSWLPPDNLAGILGIPDPANTGFIRIDGATITDIRDDAVGGDTNQDGNNSSPASAYSLQFMGSNQDHLMNSTIKFCAVMGHIGSMKISGNNFLALDLLTPDFVSYAQTDTVNAVPVITDNTFTASHVSLLGVAPIVERNTLHGGGIQIGPAMVIVPHSNDQMVGPSTGMAIISNNRVFSDSGNPGIEIRNSYPDLLSKTRFVADIRNNTLRGGSPGGSGVGSAGLSLPLEAEATAIGNDVSNYQTPLSVPWSVQNDASRLTINSNRFSLEGYRDTSITPSLSLPDTLWKNGVFVNAENNYWGDPSGPFDNSNADGEYNPRGKGIRVGDGIRYIPFIGGPPPLPQDTVHITVSATPTDPLGNLGPNTLVTFNVSADSYDLESAPTGKIFVVIRDVDGLVLNQPETSVDITSANRSAGFPPIQIKVPELSSVVAIEAIIVPDGGEGVHSNLQSFAVDKAPSGFTVLSIADTMTGNLPNVVRGGSATMRVTLGYTLTTTRSGRFEVDVEERVRGTGTVLQALPLVTVDAPPGMTQTAMTDIPVNLPLRDAAITSQKTELAILVVFKDDQGAVVGKDSRVLPINDGASTVGIIGVLPLKIGVGLAGRSYFLVGENPVFAIGVEYSIHTPNVTDWQLFTSPIEVLDATGHVIQTYFTQTGPRLSDLKTGASDFKNSQLAVNPPILIAAGARTLRFHARLVAPSQNLTVAEATQDAPVRDAAAEVAQAVPVGASQESFGPLPVTLSVASNQNAGTITVDEFAAPFSGGAAMPAIALRRPRALNASTAGPAGLIPLNRYWSVYGDLQDGTFAATVSFTYDPATDFPNVPGFNENRLVIAGLNPLSGGLEILPSTLDVTAHTISTAYMAFFDTYVVASLSASATAGCTGDCNTDDAVTVDEILTMVNIALGQLSWTACVAGDASDDGQITIDEILAAVNAALNGCATGATPPPTPTVTASPSATVVPSATGTTAPTPSPTPPLVPTATPTATSQSTSSATPTPTISRTPTVAPTLTPTPSRLSATATSSPSKTPATPPGDTSLAKSVAGGAVAVANGMATIPSVMTALVSGLQASSASLSSALSLDDQIAAAASTCATQMCSGGFGNVTLMLTLSSCQLTTPTGSVTVDGTITLNAGGFSFCPSAILPPWAATVNIEATFKDHMGAKLLTARATNLTATVDPDLGGDCKAKGADLSMMKGEISTEFSPEEKVTVTFVGTSLTVAVTTFDPQCVPVKYSLTFTGTTMLSTGASSSDRRAAAVSVPQTLTFDAFVMSQDASTSPTQTRMDGKVSADCFGGGVTLMTADPLTEVVGEACPSSGRIQITAPPGRPQVLYLAGGMVGIDTDFDGKSNETFASCLDSALLACTGQTTSATATSSPSSTATPTMTSAGATATQGPAPTPTATEGLPSPTMTPPAPTTTASVAVTNTPSFTAASVATSTPTLAQTATPTVSVLSHTATPTGAQTPTRTGTVGIARFCDSPPEAAIIPDDVPAGINRTIAIGDNRTIADLNVQLDVAHTFVGDLKVTLTHADIGTTVVLLDRPGVPASQLGCNLDDISCTLDDEGARTAEDQCLPSASMNAMPAIDGSVKPNSPLSAFDGQSLAGTWRLNISDNVQSDSGLLFEWCLEVNSPAPVITDFTCNGQQTCTIPVGQAFSMAFSFFDPDGNANAWTITAIQDDQQRFDLAADTITPASGSGTIPVNFQPFTCSSGSCRTTEYDFVVTVTDTDGLSNRATRVHVTVPATG